MIKDKKISKIVNEVLKYEKDKTVDAFLQVEKLNREITGNSINMDYRNMVLLYPKIMLEYVENIEKTINLDQEQSKIIEKAQKQLERWITIYEGKNIIENCYEYLQQEKEKIDQEFRKQSRKKEQEETLLKASARVGGIALRNLQRENNNLDGEIEEYPYSKEELKMIDKFSEITKKQELLEEYNELYYEGENEEDDEM